MSSREYMRQYMRDREARLQRVCACGNPMGADSRQCRKCANRKMRHPGNRTFGLMLKHHPEKRQLFCMRCEIRFDDYIPRYRDTDHCSWCEEELQRGGRMVIGAGLEEAGGWIQIPDAVMDETVDKVTYNRFHRKQQAGKHCACGKLINERSTRCAACAAREYQERRLNERRTVHAE